MGPARNAGPSAAKVDAAADAAKAETTATTGRAFADRLSGSGNARLAKGDGPRHPGNLSVHDLAADLRAGKLDGRSAVDNLIDRVVSVQLGQDAPARVRDRVQAALREALDDDPLLAEKLRGL
jgi:hypothetical protein